MKNAKNIFKLKAMILLALLGFGAVSLPSLVNSNMSDYCSIPPFIANSIPPNVLIVLDNSGSMNDQAYARTYDPTQFTSGYYYGYFDPTKNYQYTANGRWEVTAEPMTNGTAANPIASGNFLNWATMRRVDISKKLLIGGKANPRSPQGAVTVKLEGENSPTSWNFSKDFDNTSVPNLIYPFTGNYKYSMTGNKLTISPLTSGSSIAATYPIDNIDIHAGWTVVGASSAWNAVDEISSDGDSTYIANSSSTSMDDQAIFDYSYTGGALSGTISSVTIKAVARRTGSGTRRLRGVLRVNGTDYNSSFSNLSTSYSTYSFTFSVNPATGLTWQWSDFKPDVLATLNGFGVKAASNASSSNSYRVTQVYMEIATVTPSGGPYNIIIDQGMQKAEGLIDRLSSGVRFGLAFYNRGNGIESGQADGRYDGAHIENYVDFGSTVNMITSIQNMSPSTWTPLAETLYEMVRYFRQESPYYSGNSPADYQTGTSYDPYYYQYSKLAGSGLTDQYVPCADSFILMLTDGESTMDENIPSSLRDYDNDGLDPGTYGYRGTDYLDDVALWARTVDARPGTCSGDDQSTWTRPCIPGTQNIVLYTVFMFGRGSPLLKDAAINGGFNDLNKNNQPDCTTLPAECYKDSNRDGSITSADLPLTYYEGDDGYALEASITNAIADILTRAASGTAVSVLTTSARGVGSIVQAYFLPVQQEGIREVLWSGFVQNLWIDPQDNLREDTDRLTNTKVELQLDIDKVMKLYFDQTEGETKAAFFSTNAYGTGGSLATCTQEGTSVPFAEVKSLFEAGKKLAKDKLPSQRTVFTATKVVRGLSTIYTFSTASCGSVYTTDTNCFSVANVTGNTTLSGALNPDATYTAENIVRYIRGECLETGVTGDTGCSGTPVGTYRDRRVTVDDSGPYVWKLGDIISSTPKVLANTPLNTYHIDYNDRTYYDYLASSSYKQRSSVAFVGANDGMLHAFRVGYLKDKSDSYGTLGAYVKALFKNFYDSGDDANDKLGEEIWGYIPFNAFPYLKYLADPNYCHIYYSDLSVRLIDASINGNPTDTKIDKTNWKTLLIGGMRFGGACGTGGTPADPPTGTPADVGFSSYFAIDVTNPESPVPLWEFSDDDMGYATTYPSIIRTGDPNKNGYWYVAFGSGSKVLPKGGIDIGKSTPGYIYILDLKTGALAKKIGLDHNAIVGDILAIDANKDYHAEKIYFGTAYKPGAAWQGKLMSIEIPKQDLSSAWTPTIRTLFSGNYPFTASPDAVKDKSGKVWVYAGSGKYYSDLDKIDTSTQIFFGLKDDPDSFTYPIAEIALYDATNVQTIGEVTGTTAVCMYDPDTGWGEQTVVTSITPTAYTTSITEPGWKVYLSSRERVISRPLAVGGLVDFLTYKPSSDICSYGGDSYIYSLSYTTGVAPYNVAILSPKITSGTTGTVEVKKGVLLGPGAPPAGEAIIIVPPKEGEEELKKKIQIATGVVIEAENEPVYSVISKIVHWLKK